MTECERAIEILEADASMLTGWTTRVIQTLAHLREAWCVGDHMNRAAAGIAIGVLRQALHNRKSNAGPLAERVLVHGLDTILGVKLLRETAPDGDEPQVPEDPALGALAGMRLIPSEVFDRLNRWAGGLPPTVDDGS